MVGTVLQDTDGQFIGLTVAEDIAFVLENDCMAQEEMFRKVDGVAETVEVKNCCIMHHRRCPADRNREFPWRGL